MTAEIPPIVDDRRQGERRVDWHTPNDCFKLLDVQKTMDSIFGELADGRARMDCIERKLEANHRAATDGLNRLASSQEENTEKTDRIFEIVLMGEGLFKTTKFIGKWIRKAVMWVVPPIAAVIGLWQMLFNKTH